MLRNVNGCQIHYEVLENASSGGTSVLFLHGWGCELGIYSGLMDAMRDKATLVGLDFPAHGTSDEPPEPWGVKEFALQVMRLLETLDIKRVHIVAHSFGARVAIYLAAYEPQLIDKLVITGGAGLKKPATAESQKRTARYKRLRSIANLFMKIPPLKKPMQKVQNRLVRKYGSEDYAKLNESMRATFVKIVSEDLQPLLGKVDAPTLLIWGGDDRETPLWMGQTMEREIRDAGLVVFEGRSHYAFLEESARFLLIVKQFLWGGNE